MVNGIAREYLTGSINESSVHRLEIPTHKPRECFGPWLANPPTGDAGDPTSSGPNVLSVDVQRH